jgi:hypothetical protein
MWFKGRTPTLAFVASLAGGHEVVEVVCPALNPWGDVVYV